MALPSSDSASLSPDYDNDSLPDCVDEDDDNDGVIDQLDFYPKDFTRSRFGGQKSTYRSWWWTLSIEFFVVSNKEYG